MASNNSNKQNTNNYQGRYQGSSAPRVVPSSLSAAAASHSSSSSGQKWGGGGQKQATQNEDSPKAHVAPDGSNSTTTGHHTQARGNMPMNPYHQQQQQQQQAAMYRQHYGAQSFHHMNPYHQQQLYIQQQQQQQQRLYMMQQQQRQQQYQQHAPNDSANTSKSNTPVTVYRSNYYASHGNAPPAAQVPPGNRQNSNSNASSGKTMDNGNGSTNSTISSNGAAAINKNIPASSVLRPAYPTQSTQYGHHHPNPYMAGGNRPVNAGVGGPNVVPPVKPKKKLIITDKDGKPIDLTGVSSASPSTTTSTDALSSNNANTTDPSAPASTPTSAPKEEDAGAKMRAIAERNIKENLSARAERERLEKERLEKERFEKEMLEKERLEKVRLEKERLENERLEKERLKKERMEKERLEKEKLEKEKQEKERAEKERLRQELDRERNKSPVPPVSRVGLRPGGFRPGGGSAGLRPGGPLRPGGGRAGVSMQTSSGDTGPSMATNGVKRTYTKLEILRFRDLPACCERASDLPDMTITTNYRQPGSNHRGQGGGQNRPSWARGNTPSNPGGSTRNGGHQSRQGGQKNNWSRGEAPPPQRPQRGGRDKRGGRGNNRYHESEYTGPVAPLVKSENRWKPQKNNSVMVAIEKKAKGILNKMTKEKFAKLSNQMCEIPILSSEMLTMMIHKVYEKAIYEPAFGDMYADLCCRLADNVSPEKIIKIIRSNEPKPDTSEMKGKELDRWQKYDGGDTWRWTNDVAVDDNEVVGPFDSVEDCHNCALNGTGDPSPRGETTLTLVECTITDGVFCKVSIDETENKYYCVYFPVEDAKDCNQQLSQQFPTEEVCQSDALKQNSFKRTLLNKCEDEFNKQDIYMEWKKEKEEYESGKDKLTERERAEKKEELDFRRMNIKKQMLGNIKFIGELYKKNMIRENIMHFCIRSLLKVKEDESESEEMDDEDHEALCNLFSTIGKHLDTPKNEKDLRLYFKKMKHLSEDEENLSFRSRFMYKDLIDLRKNRWKVRREELKAKTINEIRKEAAREEREKEKQSAYNRNYDNRGGRGSSNRRESAPREKSRPVVDSSGFTQVSHGRGGTFGTQQSFRKSTPAPKSRAPEKPQRSYNATSKNTSKRSKAPTPAPAAKAPMFEPLSEDKFKLRSKNIVNEFIQDSKNTSELFLSFDELTGTENAGKTFVQLCIDSIVDMKSNEIEVMVSMLQILYKGKKLVTSDIEFGLGETIEFLDSFIHDCPKIFTYIGDILSKFLHLGALSLSWICEVCEKMFAMKDKLIEETVQCMKSEFGADESSSTFLKFESSLVKLLGESDWNKIKSNLK